MKAFLKAGLVAFLALGLGTSAHAATINVTTVADEADGSCVDGDCSLRDAVSSALPGDTVSVPAGTYFLSLGAISIDKNLTLTGAGARSTIIDGNFAFQVFLVGLSNQNAIVQISDLTIRNGAQPGFGFAGGIENKATLTVTRCIVTENAGLFGGGISNLGSLVVQESTLEENFGDNSGGGIFNAGSLTLVNSTISNSSGGGIYNRGGQFLPTPAMFTAINSTIASNSNFAGAGGGVSSQNAQLNLVNTILSGNFGGDCARFAGVVQTSDHSLDSDGSCGLTGPGDQSGVDPLLGPLADNGGPTDTHALGAGTPAVDAGSSADCPAIDQRGVSRPQLTGCDIGAFELFLNEPPVCSAAAASPSRINLPLPIIFVSVHVNGVTDPDGDPVTITITGIRQDEPVGLLHPDGTGVGSSTAHVRAEANLLLGLGGNGRVYHIGFTANDGKGGTCTGTVKVGATLLSLFPAVDGGALYDSTL